MSYSPTPIPKKFTPLWQRTQQIKLLFNNCKLTVIKKYLKVPAGKKMTINIEIKNYILNIDSFFIIMLGNSYRSKYINGIKHGNGISQS